jgi:glycosyltransferase involved in cell wall biosynthesis
MTSNGRLRVLMLAHNIEGIGTYYRFEQLALRLSRLGIPTTLVAGSAGGARTTVTALAPTLTKILVPGFLGKRASNGGFDPWGILFRIRYILQNKFEIVHASEHRPASLLPALAARHFQRTTFVGDWADWWGRGGIAEIRPPVSRPVFGLVDNVLENRAHRSADGLTVISRTLRERALGLGVHANKLLIIPNGADVEGIRPMEKTEARRRTGLPQDGKYLVYAGQAAIDMDLLWDSFPIVESKYPGRVYLLVLGRRWRLPPSAEAASRWIIQMGMVERDAYAAFLACGDIMLLPLRNQGVNRARWPGKFCDYLAAGRPVVANPTGDIRPILETDGVGLTAGEAPADFAGAVLALLNDPAECERMGARARQFAEDTLSWEHIARPLPDFYRTLLPREA